MVGLSIDVSGVPSLKLRNRWSDLNPCGHEPWSRGTAYSMTEAISHTRVPLSAWEAGPLHHLLVGLGQLH